MDEYSPWGSAADDAPLPLPPLTSSSSSFSMDLPSSFSATGSSSGGGGGWGDDGGGWGSTTDEYSSGFGAPVALSSGHKGVDEETTEDLDEHQQRSRSAAYNSGAGTGWGNTSPTLPPVTPSFSDTTTAEAEHTIPPIASRSAALSDEPEGFAQSPTMPTFAHPTSPSDDPDLIPSAPASPELDHPVARDDDWGAHGADYLPPIVSNLKISSSPEEPRTWGGHHEEDNWQPSEIPPPLPTMGNLFGESGKGKMVEGGQGEEEEGWGGVKDLDTEWRPPGGDGKDYEEERDDVDEVYGDEDEIRARKSIPAALVDGIKVDARVLADGTWQVHPDEFGSDEQERGGEVPLHLNTLLEPPISPPNSTITATTPLPTLFKLTPTLYPSYRDGIDKTALKTAETLKGSGSSAYKTAKFGMGWRRNVSGPSFTVDEKEQPPLETPVMASNAAKPPAKSSWWSRGKGADSAVVEPKKEEPPASPVAVIPEPVPPAASPSIHGEPSAINRFIGRFRHASPANDASGSSTPSNTEQDEWETGGTTYDDGPRGQVAQAKYDDSQMDDQLANFFGESQATKKISGSRTSTSTGDFGGLLGGLAPSTSLSKPAFRGVKKSTKSLDPFDPFADDDEPYNDGLPPIAPRVASPPIVPSARTSSPFSLPVGPPSQVQSFPDIAAPQARNVSSLTSASTSNGNDDFFDTMLRGPKATNPAPRVASPAYNAPSSLGRLPILSSPPPRASTLSPPIRASTISPTYSAPAPRASSTIPATVKPPPPSVTARSASPSINLFAPPPPPLQPVTRGVGGFNIAPPPPSISPVGARNVTPTSFPAPPPAPGGSASLSPPVAPTTGISSTSAAKAPAPKPAGSGGPLSSDDLSFFESL